MIVFFKKFQVPFVVVSALMFLLLMVLHYNKQGYCYKTGTRLSEAKLAAMVAERIFKHAALLTDSPQVEAPTGRVPNKKYVFLIPRELEAKEVLALPRGDKNPLEQAVLLLNDRMVDVLGEKVLSKPFTVFDYEDQIFYGDSRTATVRLILAGGLVSQKNNTEVYKKIDNKKVIGFVDKIFGFGNFFYKENFLFLHKSCCFFNEKTNEEYVNERFKILKEALNSDDFFAVSNCGDLLFDDRTEAVFSFRLEK